MNRDFSDVWFWRPGSLRLWMAVAEGPDCMTMRLFSSASLSTSEMGYFTEGYLSTMKYYGLSLHAGTLEDSKEKQRKREAAVWGEDRQMESFRNSQCR